MPLTTEVNDTAVIDTMVQTLTDAMIKAQDMAVPRVPKRRHQLFLPDYVIQNIRERNRLKRRLQRNPNMNEQLRPRINELNFHIKNDINEVRNQNFNNMLSQISADDQNRSLFQTSKFLRNRNNHMPPLKSDNQTFITAQEKADLLASQFAENHTNPLSDTNRSHTAFVQRSTNRFLNRSEPDENTIDLAYPDEIRSICKKLKNSKAPGVDKVHNTLIKHLPCIGILYLTMIINSCLRLSYFPDNWKHAEVIAIKKAQKPPNLAQSYRPISLLSSLSKILERVILIRLNQLINEKNVIPEQQHGFRTNRSTTTLLYEVYNRIKSALDQGWSTGMILLDVEKAYDRV